MFISLSILFLLLLLLFFFSSCHWLLLCLKRESNYIYTIHTYIRIQNRFDTSIHCVPFISFYFIYFYMILVSYFNFKCVFCSFNCLFSYMSKHWVWPFDIRWQQIQNLYHDDDDGYLIEFANRCAIFGSHSVLSIRFSKIDKQLNWITTLLRHLQQTRTYKLYFEIQISNSKLKLHSMVILFSWCTIW